MVEPRAKPGATTGALRAAPLSPLWVRIVVLIVLVGIAMASIYVIDKRAMQRNTPVLTEEPPPSPSSSRG